MTDRDKVYQETVKGFWRENPVFIQLLGLCPALAVTNSAINGLAMGIVPFFTRLAGRAQSGYIFTYAFAMVLGILVLVTWMTLTGGAE